MKGTSTLRKAFPELDNDIFRRNYGSRFAGAYRKVSENLGRYIGIGELDVNLTDNPEPAKYDLDSEHLVKLPPASRIVKKTCTNF